MEQHFVSFYIDQQLYSIDIRVVNDVNRHFILVPVPRAEPALRGLVNIRGQVVLVFDLAVMFGDQPRPITSDSHLIVFKTDQALTRVPHLDPSIDPLRFGDKPYALLVDQIGDVISAASEDIEPPDQYVDHRNFQHFRGLVKVDERIMTILDPMILFVYQSESQGGGGYAQ